MKQWLYKKNNEPKIYEGEAVEKALSDGWVDTPTKFKKELEDLDLEQIKTIAIKQEIKFPANIGKDRLIEKLREG